MKRIRSLICYKGGLITGWEVVFEGDLLRAGEYD